MNPRFENIVNLKQFSQINQPLLVGKVCVNPPQIEQKVLRMLVFSPYSGGFQVPNELSWIIEPLKQANDFQSNVIGIRHPYVYVTVRHGKVSTVNDDLWHVDGFSVRYNHLPESNYVFVLGNKTTEYLNQVFEFPNDFDPLKHNVHLYFQKRANENEIRCMEEGMMYHMDPYVVHRRPPNIVGDRTFVRFSFTPMEIPDMNNTHNPLIQTTHYLLDGVKGFRDLLSDYDFSRR